MTFDLRYQLTPQMLWAYQRAAQRRLSTAASKAMGWRGEAINVAVACAFAGLIWFASYLLWLWSGRDVDIPSLALGFVAGCAMVFVAFWHRSLEVRRLMMAGGNAAFNPYHAVIDETQLRFSNARAETVLRWPSITEITLDKDVIVLWMEPGQGCVIPNSAFTNEVAAKAFIAFAQARIAATLRP